MQPKSDLSRRLEVFSQRITAWTGSTPAFLLAVSTILVWAITGPLFGYSETWQLVINTGTTIITFLMVFLIQRAQNKDSLVLHLKLNELIAATKGASNRMINAEEFGEHELAVLHQFYVRLVEEAKLDADLLQTHSVEEAEQNQFAKHQLRQQRPPAPPHHHHHKLASDAPKPESGAPI